MKRTALVVAFTLLATVAWAHRDRVLFVLPDGALYGIPTAYGARLNVAFSEDDAGALQQLTFVSSGQETSVQPCLLRLVPKGSFSKLSVAGSWYHDESLVPHYVGVKFGDSPSQPGMPALTGVVFLFSLRDASLLEVTVQNRNIRLSNSCPA